MRYKTEYQKAMRRLLLLFCISFSIFCVSAQETKSSLNENNEQNTDKVEKEIEWPKRLKISGYIQSQYQYGEKDASLKVGSKNGNKTNSFNRVGIRRGRIKFLYEHGIGTGVFQLDITEKGVGLKDVYFSLTDPWLKSNDLKVGVFDRPFGHEIAYSSSRRESPERSTIFQTLFPDERDLGAMIQLQTKKESSLHFLKLEAGLFAGNGINTETDNRKDFIGHLSANKAITKNIRFGAGVSYYHGAVYQQTQKVYTMQDKVFVVNEGENNQGKFAKREYFGFDGQLSISNIWGKTQVRGEYLFGLQPGGENSSKSPNYSIIPTALNASDTYLRNFSGGYIILVQDIGKLPFSAVLKYDWYDPNTKVAKNEIGDNGTGKADLAQSTLGIGGLWRIDNNLRLQAYYEINILEISEYEPVSNNYKGNVFTMRLQYKF